MAPGTIIKIVLVLGFLFVVAIVLWKSSEISFGAPRDFYDVDFYICSSCGAEVQTTLFVCPKCKCPIEEMDMP